MAFLAPLWLSLAALAAVPVLLHLLRRNIGSRVEFPAVRYLQSAERDSSRDVRAKNLFPLGRKRLLHHRPPAETPSPHPPVREGNQSEQEPQSRGEPGQQSRRPGHQGSGNKGLPLISTIGLRRHDHP